MTAPHVLLAQSTYRYGETMKLIVLVMFISAIALGSGYFGGTGGGGGGGTWGSITGTLSKQTDLNNALNGKEPTITGTSKSTDYYGGDKTFHGLPAESDPIYSKSPASGIDSGDINSWDGAASHKTTEDAINGIVKGDGKGGYTAVTDNHTAWDAGGTLAGQLNALNGVIVGDGKSGFTTGSYLTKESDPVAGAVSGIIKGDGIGGLSAAKSGAGNDYLSSELDPVVGAITGIVKADGKAGFSAAKAGTDYVASETDPVYASWKTDLDKLNGLITGDAKGGYTATTAATFMPAAGTGLIENLNFMVRDFGNLTIPIEEYANYARTINAITLRSNTGGTVTVAVQICPDGVSCASATGCDAISVTSSQSTTSCTAANSITAADRLQIVLSSVSALTDLYGSVKTTR